MDHKKPSVWSQSGPFLLLGAFAVLIDKCDSLFWPLLITAFIGYAASLAWKKRGLYISFTFLVAAATFTISRGGAALWTSLLSLSIGFSWLLILLGKLELDQFFEKSEENAEKRCQGLEDQLRQALKSHAEAAQALGQTRKAVETSEKEREQLTQKLEQLSQDILEYRSKHAALQYALEDAHAQLLQLKNQQTPAIVQEEGIDPQEKMQLSQVQRQYALLREQFEEKSEILDKTRKELFHMENAFLALQRFQEEMALEASEENLILVKDMKQLEEECRDLEMQVQNLQEIITALQAPKKRIVRTRKLKGQEDLPDLIQEKIDQVNSVKTS